MKKVFQRGESPNFAHFPSETYALMLKYQKLEKSVEGNWGFWIIFDFKDFGIESMFLNKSFIQMAIQKSV